MKKKSISQFGITALTVVFCSLIFTNINKNDIVLAETRETYVVEFNSSKNVLTSSDTPTSNLNTSPFVTNNGAKLYFNNQGIYKTEDTWQVIGNNGFIRTNNQISGIKSISITFSDYSSRGTITYGWSHGFYYTTALRNAKEEIDSSGGLEQTYYLNNEQPNFFAINCDADQTIGIAKMVVTYSCVAATQPPYYKNYLVQFYNSRIDSNGNEVLWTNVNNKRYQYYYGDHITTIPDDPTSSGRTFVSWYYEGKPWDFEKGVVTSDMTFMAHYDTKYNYIEYVLNEDNTTYTAKISANYQANIILPDTDSLFYSSLNWDNSYFKLVGQEIDNSQVSKIILGENCISLSNLAYFPNLEEVVLTGSVKTIDSKAFYNNKILNKLTIEGDLPEISNNALIFNGSSNLLRIYVNEEVYNSLENKFIVGYQAFLIGENLDLEIKMSIQEFRLKSREQSFKIANYFYNKCKTEFDFKILNYPYVLSYEFAEENKIENWSEIRNFTLNLVSGLQTDQEKVDTIFDWFGDWIYNDSKASNSIITAFREKTGVCGQYALVLHDMLSAADISSVYVRGTNGAITDNETVDFALNYDRRDGSKTHGWVLANVDGEWKYLDTMGDVSQGWTLESMEDKWIYLPSHYDLNVLTMPEEIVSEALDLFKYNPGLSTRFIENKVRVNPESNGNGSGLILNGNYFEIGATAYSESANSRLIKFFGDYEYEIGEIVTNCIVYSKNNVHTPYYSTGNGRVVPIHGVVKYLIAEYSYEFALNIFEGTQIDIDQYL